MRTFAAIELPELFADEAAAVVRQLASVIQARYIPRENYHITLAFLGDIPSAHLDHVANALEEAVRVSPQFTLRPDGLGRFGEPRDATLWMGIEAVPGLIELHERLIEGLGVRGILFDEKPFRPHITLARRARITDGALPQLLFPQDAVAQRVSLFRSTLTPDGALYEALETFDLEGLPV